MNQFEASEWTEAPKSVFFIRVDFSDQPGTVVTQAALDEVLNTKVADSFTKMSYGKTTIAAKVSSATVRMPKPKTDYLPSNNAALYNPNLKDGGGRFTPRWTGPHGRVGILPEASLTTLPAPTAFTSRSAKPGGSCARRTRSPGLRSPRVSPKTSAASPLGGRLCRGGLGEHRRFGRGSDIF